MIFCVSALDTVTTGASCTRATFTLPPLLLLLALVVALVLVVTLVLVVVCALVVLGTPLHAPVAPADTAISGRGRMRRNPPCVVALS